MLEIGEEMTEEKLAEKIKYGLKTDSASASFRLGDKKIIIGRFEKFDKGGIIITDIGPKPSVLYPTDISKINRGYTFSRTDE